MSYEIYYDRAYIRVNERFIPLVNQGSNNCWEYNYFTKRDIPEKNWQVLNWEHGGQLLFMAEEVREQATLYEESHQRSGTCYRSRNTSFAPGEFRRWIVNGMNNAYTIEEYVSFGNALSIHDFSVWENRKNYPFRTTEEFLALLEQLQGSTRLNVHFGNSREVYRPALRRAKPQPFDHNVLPEYFVLKFDLGYFAKLRKRGFLYTFDAAGYTTRKFLKESDAAKYLAKYQERLSLPFTIERVSPAKKEAT
jgi:hypothetical protein